MHVGHSKSLFWDVVSLTREGCFLQLPGNTFQCTLTNTTAEINGYMVVALKGSHPGLQIGCLISRSYPRMDHVLWSRHKHSWDVFALSPPPTDPVDAVEIEISGGLR